MKSYLSEHSGSILMSDQCVWNAVSVMASIVEAACEHEKDLDLMRLVNYMDLYRTYLTHAITRVSADDCLLGSNGEAPRSSLEPELVVADCASFEQFIGDFRLLRLAASALSREGGIAVATPPPLKLCANDSI